MRISVNRQSGFSLIEILVVMFIVALLTGVLMLSINFVDNEKSEFETELDRIIALSTLAEEQSVVTGEPIGLVINPPRDDNYWRYSWQRYRGGQWVDTEAPLTGGRFPENIELSLEVEGELVEFPKLDDEDLPLLPSVVFYPGGEVTPFIMTLFNASGIDEQQILTSQRNGRLEHMTEQEALDFL